MTNQTELAEPWRGLHTRLVVLGAAIVAQRTWGERQGLEESGTQDDALAALALDARSIADALAHEVSAAISSQPPAPRGPGLVSDALQGIETACNYSPHREANTWDEGLAKLIHHHARLLAAPAQVREQAALEGLSAQIMNIRCQNPPPISLSSGFTAQREAQAYREGHRDARHAAAELVDARVSLTGTVSTGGNE